MHNKNHTSKRFDGELKALRHGLLAMGERAEQQIACAIDAVLRGDASLADQVIAADAQIDQDELDLDELAFFLLAQRQPVASDLRLVMLALKIVTDLERIGDLAVNIAKRGRELTQFRIPQQLLEHLARLAAAVRKALRSALEAFAGADAERAEQVISGDREIDTLNLDVIAHILSLGASSGHEVARSIGLSSVSRYLERIGDHATNIAEMVIYYVRGRDIRHHRARPRPGTRSGP